MTAGDVIAMLRRHYLPEGRPPGGVFAAEIEAPNGRRRADLLWVPLTIAGGREIVGHEVKVSRADVLAELADPTKADPWSRYCHRWWLVVADPALVDGVDVPAAWGIMAPPSGRRTRSMTVLRPAPLLDPVDPAPALRRVLSWLHYGSHETTADLRRQLDDVQRISRYQGQQLDELRAAGGPSHPDAARIAGILAALDGRVSRYSWGRLSDEDVVEALLDLSAARTAARSVRIDTQRLMNAVDAAVESIVDPFRLSRAQLRRALGEGAGS